MAKVKFIPRQRIEQASQGLIAEFCRRFGQLTEPPVPVGDILEAHLGLRLDFDDLAVSLGVPDVLGATWVGDRQVLIDQSLDPEETPSLEGRYRFTLAHELGHWDLHRHHFLANPGQRLLFDEPTEPSVVCRSSSSKEPMEWQADMFAGYLLMPKEMVLRAWAEEQGGVDPYNAKEEITDLSARWGLAEDRRPTVEVARQLATRFKVSGQAMQIRLIGMGLIRTEEPVPDLMS